MYVFYASQVLLLTTLYTFFFLYYLFLGVRLSLFHLHKPIKKKAHVKDFLVIQVVRQYGSEPALNLFGCLALTSSVVYNLILGDLARAKVAAARVRNQ